MNLEFPILNSKKFFIFELANNHNGSFEEAKKMVLAAKKIVNHNYLEFAVKLQYRDLETFIHKNADPKQNKHIKRFIETKLTRDEYKKICSFIKENKFNLVITPFDEKSVEYAIDDNVDIIKIASCSNTDWPLIEKIASAKKPVICSTGGLDLDGIDNIYSFFQNRKVPLALLHCVSIYPTENFKDFNLNFIKKMIKRYPKALIGYSGHEEEKNFIPVLGAAALGAKIFERHFSISDKKNKYSINDIELKKLINQLSDLCAALGSQEKTISQTEKENLNALRRGVFAKSEIKKDGKINKDNFYYAFPKINIKQIEPGDLSKVDKLEKNLDKDEEVIANLKNSQSNLIRKYVHRYKHMLYEAGVVVANDSRVELSHHKGIENIEKYGALLATIVNGQYCKKVIALFPSQFHPKHKHYKKVETFHVLSGTLIVEKDDGKFTLNVGDKLDIFRDEWHAFTTKTGAIFEEISTEALKQDSKYFDEEIENSDTIFRKTYIPKF